MPLTSAPTREMTGLLGRGRRWTRSPIALWAAFALVHAGLVLVGLYGPGLPLGDVQLAYYRWIDDALRSGYVVGVNAPWVYPIVAIVPMLAAAVFGMAAFVQTWLALVIVLDAIAFGILIDVRRPVARRHVAAWWWLAFLVLLGPVALGRIDAVTVPIAIVALLVVAGRPRLGALLLTIAAWIKVWPAAVIAALAISAPARLRILATAAVASLVIVVLALVAGSGWNAFSFITEQTGRGLQIESPVSTIWMWQAAARVPGASVYYDQDILTYQVTGEGTEIASAVMTPLLLLVVGAIVLFGLRAQLRGARFVSLLPPLALALVLAFIVVNKVGSPQYMCWLAPPVVIGILYQRSRYLLPAVATLVLAALTQAIYPSLYGWLLIADPLVVSLLTLRNLLEVGLLVWAVIAVWRSAPRRWSGDGARMGRTRISDDG